MTINRFNAKRDANEKLIVDYLQARGVYVHRLDKPVDLLMGYKGRTYLAEVKDGTAKLNANQRKFFDEWTGSPPVIFRTIEDCADWLRQR